jgi:hypothetical protein
MSALVGRSWVCYARRCGARRWPGDDAGGMSAMVGRSWGSSGLVVVYAGA